MIFKSQESVPVKKSRIKEFRQKGELHYILIYEHYPVQGQAPNEQGRIFPATQRSKKGYRHDRKKQPIMHGVLNNRQSPTAEAGRQTPGRKRAAMTVDVFVKLLNEEFRSWMRQKYETYYLFTREEELEKYAEWELLRSVPEIILESL